MIAWNQKAFRYLSEVQMDALEAGKHPRRMVGSIKIDKAGNVWYHTGGGNGARLIGVSDDHRKLSPEAKHLVDEYVKRNEPTDEHTPESIKASEDALEESDLESPSWDDMKTPPPK